MESSCGVLTDCVRRTWEKKIAYVGVVRVSFLEEVDSVAWIHTLEDHMERVFQSGEKITGGQKRKSCVEQHDVIRNPKPSWS